MPCYITCCILEQDVKSQTRVSSDFGVHVGLSRSSLSLSLSVSLSPALSRFGQLGLELGVLWLGADVSLRLMVDPLQRVAASTPAEIM